MILFRRCVGLVLRTAIACLLKYSARTLFRPPDLQSVDALTAVHGTVYEYGPSSTTIYPSECPSAGIQVTITTIAMNRSFI